MKQIFTFAAFGVYGGRMERLSLQYIEAGESRGIEYQTIIFHNNSFHHHHKGT